MGHKRLLPRVDAVEDIQGITADSASDAEASKWIFGIKENTGPKRSILSASVRLHSVFKVSFKGNYQ